MQKNDSVIHRAYDGQETVVTVIEADAKQARVFFGFHHPTGTKGALVEASTLRPCKSDEEIKGSLSALSLIDIQSYHGAASDADDATTASALVLAFNSIPPQFVKERAMISALLQQQGADEPGCDGMLHKMCDVWIFG